MIKAPKQQLYAGETFNLSVTDAGLSALVVRVRGSVSEDITAEKNGSAWVATADTSEWKAGQCQFEAFGTYADGTKSIIVRAPFTVIASLEAEDAAILDETDGRTPNEIALSEAKKALFNAVTGVRRYKINNRELENHSLGELRQLVAYYKKEVIAERRIARGQNPLGPRIALHT